MKKHLPLAALLALLPALAAAQVGIGTSTPDAKAALEIKALDKGLLIPRLTAAQRTAITSPPQGLMVYQTDGSEGFWYYAGSPGAWVFVNPSGADNLGNHTATQSLNLQGNALTGSGASIGTAVGLGVRADGGLNLGQNTAYENFFIGYQAGQANTPSPFAVEGRYNHFVGYGAGASNTTGSVNTFNGDAAGNSTTTGSSNTFTGSQSGKYNVTGSGNTFEGWGSGYFNQTGSNNTIVGSNSGPPFGTAPLLNATALGANVSLEQSNSVILGNGANVGIGTNTPAPAAALEIKSTTAGLLVPRLTVSQRTAISSPPQGLLVYQTDGTASGGTQSGFWYYTGTSSWVFLNASLTLPYSGTASTSSPAFDVTNTGTGPALSGTGSGTTTAAVQGLNNNTSGSAVGVLGTTASGYGVRGTASASGGYGVEGRATDSRGVSGFSTSGVALYGAATTGLAVQGLKGSGDRGRVAQFTSTDAANDSTALYVSTAGARPALRAVNSNTSAQAAIRGVKTAGTDGMGIEGVVTSGGGNAAGVLGNDKTGTGVGSGVIGLTAGGYGVRGIASASGGYGVSGSATDSYGIIGSSGSGVGTSGSSTSSYGVQGTTSAGNTGTAAGVFGASTGGGVGVLGQTTSGYGVRGVASASGGYGVQGVATTSYGVMGSSSSGVGAYGSSTSGYGVQGSSSSSYGVQGSSTSSYGVYGTTAAGNTGSAAGVLGTTAGAGVGVLGQTTTGYGVRGEATGSNGYAVTGVASGSSGIGLYGSASSSGTGVYGVASGTGRAAYFNQSNSSYTGNAIETQNSGLGSTAFFNQSNTSSTANTVAITSAGNSAALKITHPIIPAASNNVAGIIITDPSGQHTAEFRSNGANLSYYGPGGFSGASMSDRFGIDAVVNTYEALSVSTSSSDPTVSSLLAQAYSGALAGKFYGNVAVQGSLSKSAGSFKIDHPLDPENKYLYHSFVESPDMLNIYNGNATLDASGEAVVMLPDWFEALNRDFRYQLTSVGAFMPVFIKEKVADHRFRIGGGTPGGEVSWQVTGIRHDAYAEAHRIPVEEAKPAAERGRYLVPDAYGRPVQQAIGYRVPGTRRADTAIEAAPPSVARPHRP